MKHLITAALTFWLCLSTQADDIDIYQGQSTGIPQNVMFLMDTSRSMSRWVYLDLGPYDPNTTYPVPINGFDPETYYYGKYVDGDGSTDSETAFLHARYLHKDAIHCDGAVDIIEQYGVISGKFKRWDPIQEKWEAPGLITTGLPHGSMRTDAIWDCKNDEGVHPAGKNLDYNLINASQYVDPARNCLFGACWTPLWYTIAYEAFWLNRVGKVFKGNYLNYEIYAKNGTILGPNQDKMSRMTLARAAAKHAANTVQGFNLGLARFDSRNNGGFIDLPVGPIDTNKAIFNDKIDDYFTFGGTPLSESYFEIARYYRGDSTYFGNNSYSRIQDAIVNRFPSGLVSWLHAIIPGISHDEHTPSVPESRIGGTGNTYSSPIDSSCQSESVIVLFTDGEPQSDSGANSAIQNMIQDVNFPADSGLSKSCSGDGSCADELAYYLANFDQSDLPGRQTIRTYVVGGFLEDNTGDDDSGSSDGGSNNDLNGIPLLRSIAHHGNGEYFGANSYQEIVDALTTIFGNTSDAPATFVAPAISTNSYNRLEHQNELYYAMFSPNNRANWQGNLKVYQFKGGEIVDANDNPILGNDGVITNRTRSFWTPAGSPDGPNVIAGGAAQHLTKEHKIYTHLTTTSGALTTPISNSEAIKSLMNLPTNIRTDDFNQIINWANRVSPEASDDTRREMEDPLHSRPVIINYSATKDSNGKVIADSVIYMATNSGYLHAFKADKDSFEEYFSYVPKELLPNIAKYAKDTPLRKDSLYGLDGHINYLFRDHNKNGQVDAGDGDKVILYVGMRRGGRNYYALDVTDRNNPRYLWQIDGGSSGFERLGQTWSEPVVAKVPWNNDEKIVLLFGGGYDETEDEAAAASSLQLGNAIYMVDAETGDLLWKASKSSHDFNHADMTASMNNNIQAIDINRDRLTDYFFVTDVAGHIWRFDIDKNNTGSSNFAEGGIIFDANGDSGDSLYNRFYASPSISYFKDKTGKGFLSLAIGTGFRASPLAPSVGDEFYIIKDYHVSGKPSSYNTLTPSNLSAHALTTTHEYYQIAHNSDSSHGWKFSLPRASEKVINSALTTHGRFIFTSFSPNSDPNPGSCSYDLGTTDAYTIYFSDDNNEGPVVLPPNPPPPLPCEATNSCPPKDPPPPIPPGADPIAMEAGCSKEDPSECTCEDGGTAVLVGTSTLGNTISSCGILDKDYWMEREE